jgi:hypothetical protein
MSNAFSKLRGAVLSFRLRMRGGIPARFLRSPRRCRYEPTSDKPAMAAVPATREAETVPVPDRGQS